VAPLERLAPARPAPRYSGAQSVGQATARPAERAARREEPALPFDGVLEGILYSRDRKLAIIDGRIVAAGDEIRGARVVEITTSTVLLRDERGRLRQLTLASGIR